MAQPSPPWTPPPGHPPPSSRSGLAVALGLGALALVAVGLLAVVVAIAVVGGGSSDDTPDEGTAEQGTAPDTAAGVPTEGARAYRTGDGCIELDPPDGWVATVEHPEAGSAFAVDQAHPLERSPDPGEPGVFVELSCPRLEQVGGGGPVAAPGADLAQDEAVAFGGGQGRLLSYVFTATGGDVATVQYTVDLHGVRCSLHASGAADDVEAARSEIDAAAASLVCRGR